MAETDLTRTNIMEQHMGYYGVPATLSTKMVTRLLREHGIDWETVEADAEAGDREARMLASLRHGQAPAFARRTIESYLGY